MLKQLAWRWLILGHRWLGIGVCLLFTLWFASGLVMLYVSFPDLSRKERLNRLPPIDWAAVRTSPETMLRNLNLDAFPRDLRLEMLGREPVYRLSTSAAGNQTFSAATGERIGGVDARHALAIVRAVNDGERATVIATLERDQWTVAQTFDGHRPLHLAALNDDAGAQLYLSSRTGEIMLDSTARERAWNWVGAVAHWLYFSELRARPQVWSQVVKWLSGVGIAVAAAGLWLGVARLHVARRTPALRMTPYRGAMAWHHLAGLIGGLFLITWIASGWLSMGPKLPWQRAYDPRPRAAAMATLAGAATPAFPTSVALLHTLSDSDIREASFMWSLGRAQLVLTDGAQRVTVLDASTLAARAFTERELTLAATRFLPDAQLVATQRLDREDAYWYSRNGERTLPVLRFKFDDPERTWAHIDPRTGRLIGWQRASDRRHRWLFSALHTLDFGWLLAHPPLREALIWLLSLAGLTISISSVVIGWRRIRR